MNLKTSEYLAFDAKTLKQMARFPVWGTLQVRYQCCAWLLLVLVLSRIRPVRVV